MGIHSIHSIPTRSLVPKNQSQMNPIFIKSKLKLNLTSKDIDKKRRKREKKLKKLVKQKTFEKQQFESQTVIPTKRRFEKQSVNIIKTSTASYKPQLTRNQLNKIQVLQAREVHDLTRAGELSYKEKQMRFNKYCQEVTETNEMPCLVMTKIK